MGAREDLDFAQERATVREVVYVIGDTETPGLSPEYPPCEVALREIDPVTLETIWEIGSLIDCECDIEEGAQAIHGISREMLVDEPTMQEFVDYRLNGRYAGKDIVLIAHNAPFDKPRLDPIGNISATICTLFHARQLIPKAQVGNHKLQTLRAHFGYPENEAHRALSDVATTHRLLRDLLKLSGRTLADFAATYQVTIHRMPWGRHAGQLLVDMPRSYLQWLLSDASCEPNLRASVEKALTLK